MWSAVSCLSLTWKQENILDHTSAVPCLQHAATVAVNVSFSETSRWRQAMREQDIAIGQLRHDMSAVVCSDPYCFSLQQRPCQLDYEVLCPHMRPWRNNLDDASHVNLHFLTTSATYLDHELTNAKTGDFAAATCRIAGRCRSDTRLIPHLQDDDSSTAGICRDNAHAAVPYHWHPEQHLRNVVSR